MVDQNRQRTGKIIGFGGVFFKAERPNDLAQWYKEILGVPVSEGGVALFKRSDLGDFSYTDITLWAPFERDNQYFAPATSDFLVNYLVDDLTLMLERLKQHGILPVQPVEITKDGKFAWIMDPEGNKIELWQPLRAEDQV